MTHSHKGSHRHHHDRSEVVPRVGGAQSGGNLKLIQCQLMLLLHARRCQQRHELVIARSQQQNGSGDGEGGGEGGNGDRDAPGVTNTVARALLLNVRNMILKSYIRQKVYELFQGHTVFAQKMGLINKKYGMIFFFM